MKRYLPPALLGMALLTASARAQGGQLSASSPLSGSVPSAPASAEPVRLSLSDAVDRALKYNLGVIASEEQVARADGARLRSLKELLPQVDARMSDSSQTVNLAAFGFDTSLFPGVPSVVGPFTVFDARVAASQTIFDAKARDDVKRSKHDVEAARLDTVNTRDLVVLVVTNLYLQAVAGANRIDAVGGEVATAQALLDLATNLRNAGATPGIDVVRAQVQLQAQRQRLIAARNDFAKQKLQLVRAAGLRSAQVIELTDRQVTLPLSAFTLDEALRSAAASRADYRAAIERLHAAESGLHAAQAEILPSVSVRGDYGVIGSAPSDGRRTYSFSGAVRVPLFDTGRRGRIAEDAATLRQRQAESADLAERIESEVRSAFLDVQASEQQLAVAHERAALANQELSLARTRFTAGVTSNLEVIQAQNEVATAAEVEITSTYQFNAAKAALARTLGSTDVNRVP